MIHVIATITAAPGRRDDLLAAFRKLVPQVRQEPGCIEYGPAIDLESRIGAQPAMRTDVVTVVEKWQDLAALQRHLSAAHVRDFLENEKSLLAGLEIHVLTPV